MGGYLGIREINPNVWPSSPERGGVFPNFARSAEPTVRPNSLALEEGDMYWNTADDLLYVYTGAAWTSVGATGGSVTLTGAYTNGAGVLTITTNPVTINDAESGATNTLVINKTAAGSGNLIDINTTAAFTGDAVNITLTTSATTAQAMVITSQAAVRATNPLVDISEAGTGAVPTLEVSGDAATTGALFRLNASAAIAPVAGTDGMQTILMTNAANATEGLFISNPTTTRTGACLAISDGGETSGQLIRLVQTSTSSANVIEYTTSGAVTGDVVNLTLTNAGTTAQGIVVVGQAGAATSKLCSITANGTGNAHTALSLIAGGALSATGGALLDLSSTAAIAGDYILCTMTNAANGADGLVFTGSPTGRTGDIIRIVDAQTTGTGQSIEINSTGAKTGQHLLINVDAAAGGQGIHMDYDGAATGALFDIDLDSTGSSIIFDIDIGTGVWTGDVFNFNTSQAYAGDVFDLVLTNCAAGVRALVVTGSATTRTAKMIQLDEVGTPSGATIAITHAGASTNSSLHIDLTNAVGGIGINLDGAGTRTVNVIDIDTTGSDTASCVDITTTAVGASGVPAGLKIASTGVLVAGADACRITTTGNQSSTSSTLRVTHATGTASTQGVVYFAAASAGDIALKVDTGTCAFDEGIINAIIFPTGQTVNAGGTSTALTVAAFWHHIDADAGGDTFTLADGVTGQVKFVTMESSTGTATITPTNAAGFTSITFNAAGDSVILFFTDSKWYCMGGNSYGVV